MTEEEARRREAVVKLITALIVLCLLLWSHIPEHRRKLAEMRLAEASRRLCEQGALRLARRSMSMELATGQRRYEIPYLLSVGRDRAAAWYDRARSVTP